MNWRLSTRVGFRFCFAYLGLFALATQVTGSLLPLFSFRGLGPLSPMRDITFWIAQHVFGLNPAGASIDPSQGGENIFYVIQMVWLFVLAVAATAVWSYLDTKRAHYETLNRWFRVFVRLGLAAQMFEYAMTKIIPNQFIAPSLNTLVTPAGNLSLNTMLWTSVGAAPGYQIFTGFAELLAGILLLIPRTTLLGALICLADLAQVLSLNLSYDIGLKLTTIHLVLLTVFLLLPDARRLANFFILNRETSTAKEQGSRTALIAQLLVGAYLLASLTYINVNYWYAKGGGSPRSVFYGIWDVEQLSVDGQLEAPALADYDRRWRRAIFDAPDSLAFQRTDDSFARYSAFIVEGAKTMTLRKLDSKVWKADFTFEKPAADHLVLNGEMDGHRIEARLRLVEPDTLPLLNSGFRWIR
jgi:hypothetical protein